MNVALETGANRVCIMIWNRKFKVFKLYKYLHVHIYVCVYVYTQAYIWIYVNISIWVLACYLKLSHNLRL